MHTKTVQFNCVKCTKPVYRLGKKVDLKNQVCGKCINPNPPIIGPPCPGLSIQDKINHYKARLDRVEALSQHDTNASFIDLWQKAGE